MDAPALLLLSDLFKDLMPLVGGLLILTWLMMRLRLKRKQNVNRLTPLEEIERTQQQRGMRQDLESLMVEIEQLARRFSSQLDAKSVRLEKLLREADDRIAQLQQLPQATDSSPTSVSELPSSQSADDELAQQVYRLADQGLASDQIARQLEEHVGKVELILALRK